MLNMEVHFHDQLYDEMFLAIFVRRLFLGDIVALYTTPGNSQILSFLNREMG